MTATMAKELFALVGQLAADAATKVVVFDSANPDFNCWRQELEPGKLSSIGRLR